jgi:hypothetical protein
MKTPITKCSDFYVGVSIYVLVMGSILGLMFYLASIERPYLAIGCFLVALCYRVTIDNDKEGADGSRLILSLTRMSYERHPKDLNGTKRL